MQKQVIQTKYSSSNQIVHKRLMEGVIKLNSNPRLHWTAPCMIVANYLICTLVPHHHFPSQTRWSMNGNDFKFLMYSNQKSNKFNFNQS